MRKFEIRFYLTTGGSLTVIIEAKSDGEARRIIRAQYSSTFRDFASSKEL